MSITIKNLTKTYNQQIALDSISLNIKKGEIAKCSQFIRKKSLNSKILLNIYHNG